MRMQWKEQIARDITLEELARLGSWRWKVRGGTDSAPELLVLAK